MARTSTRRQGLLVAVVLAALVPRARAGTGETAASPLDGLKFLIGEWTSAGTGKPGEATGTFSCAWDLGGKVLVRKNHAVLPASGADHKPVAHDDLLIVYVADGKLRAHYLDSEGHAIEYEVSTSPSGATFESPEYPAAPRYRFVYEEKDAATLAITFSIAPAGGKPYQTYLEGTVRRRDGKGR